MTTVNNAANAGSAVNESHSPFTALVAFPVVSALLIALIRILVLLVVVLFFSGFFWNVFK